MESHLPPNISSFVIRFVVDQAANEQKHQPYRGAIRHIQTEEEINFSNWKEVVSFIRRFVPIKIEDDQSSV